MSILYVDYECISTGGEVCDGDENSDWPSYEDTVIEFYLTGCFLNKKKASWLSTPIVVDFDVKSGDTIYVVTVRYGTGCTFGHTTGNHHIWGIYQNTTDAKKVEQDIYQEYDRYKEDNRVGNVFNDNLDWEYRPWMGYFNSLEDIEITQLVVK